ncbi:hypothetical protein [Rhizobium sp. NFR03]|uniref:hypothetical protein n=1 Tax=Rhizobium sp. NFR03 TaxID=1566263 RepID=UPI0008C7E764|nr:hypothetical protein [Rhizobium sp. NFR03]SES47238.1 hypothetical protein SAMN03159406_04954 [Rhizobium sp. NFR03]
MYSDAELFVDDFQALQKIQENPTPKNLRDASAILRRLFLDSPALAHRVNKERRLPILFQINLRNISNDPIIDDGTLFMIEDPSVGAADAPAVKLDQFLAHEICKVGGTTMSVKDTILFFSNKAGGVHVSDTSQHDMTKYGRLLKLNDLDIGNFPMAFIVKSSIVALQPIADYLRA